MRAPYFIERVKWFSLHVLYALDVLRHREATGQAVAAHLARIQGAAPRANPHGIIFFACDARFMQRFGYALIFSCYEHAREYGVHVHLYEPPASTLRQLDALKQRCGDLNLSYTYERDIDFGALPDRGMYYTAFRFVAARKIVAESNSLTICLDADSLIMHSLQEALAAARGKDVGLYFRLRRRKLNKKIAAFCVILNNTRRSLAFTDLFCGLALKFLRRYAGYRSNFYFDQSGLYFAFLLSRLRGCRFYSIDQRVIDFAFDERACIWTAKGKRKDDEAFVNESRRIIAAHGAGLEQHA